MERSTHDLVAGGGSAPVQTGCDLLGGFVGERDCADTGRRHLVLRYESVNSSDEAVRLPGARAGQHQDRAERCFDGPALFGGGVEVGRRAVRHTRPLVTAHETMVSPSSAITSSW